VQAETILRTGLADAVALARSMFFNPHWPMLAARELGIDIAYPRPVRARASRPMGRDGHQCAGQ
jgi:2,4-dienoyl-CoA reductase-like NADH-dependent reductase (Old Yellow Enzyme family)